MKIFIPLVEESYHDRQIICWHGVLVPRGRRIFIPLVGASPIVGT